MTPFDYLNSINKGKDGDNLDTSDYVPFMIDHKLQYDFFKNSVRAGKRFAKWHKAIKPTKDIGLIMKAYKYSKEKAEQVLPILTNQQLKELYKIYEHKK
jgi:hypothetical protein